MDPSEDRSSSSPLDGMSDEDILALAQASGITVRIYGTYLRKNVENIETHLAISRFARCVALRHASEVEQLVPYPLALARL